MSRAIGGGFTNTDGRGDDVKYLGTARARLGISPFGNALLYGTAGLAWERVNRIETDTLVGPGVTQTVTTTSPRDQFGWVAGAGGEAQLFGSNFIARLEYLHYEFGQVETTTTVSTTPGTSFADEGGRQRIGVVRAGLSYKFQ